MNLRSRILLITIPINIIAIACIFLIVKSNAYDTVEELANTDTHSLLKSATLSIKNQYNSLEYHREYIIELRKKESRQIVKMAKLIVSQYYTDYKKGLLSEQEAKRQAIRKLNNFRYDNGNGYLWVNDTEKPLPRMINHPFYPEYNGMITKDPLFYTSNDSVYVPLLAANICEKQGGGFIEYMWKKPFQAEDSLPIPKTSYVELFEPWQWVIGTGVYLEDIETDVDERMTAILEELKQTMGKMELGKNGYFFIFNSHKQMLLHPLIDNNTPDSIITRMSIDAPYEEIMAAANTNAKSYEYMWFNPSTDITSKSHRKKVFVEYFKPLDWYVCASFYYDELAKPGILLGRKILLISAVFIIISFLILLYLSNSLIQPLKKLMVFVSNIPSNFKNVDQTKVPAFRLYEANKLGQVITEMLVSIKDQQNSLILEKSRAIKSEAILRSTLESINDALLIVGNDGKVSHYNKSFERLFAIPEDLLDKNNDELLLSYAKEQISDSEGFVKKVNEIYARSVPERDFVYFKDGRIMDRQFYPLISESPVKGGVWVFRDITKNKQVEEEYRVSEERLRLTLETAQIGIWDWNLENDTWYTSPIYFTMLGYRPESGQQDRKIWLQRVHPEDREEVKEKINLVVSQKESSYSYEVRMLHANGSYRWHQVTGHVVGRDKEGNMTRMVGIRRDINDYKCAEENLKRNQKLLTESQRIAHLGSWDMDIPSQNLYWNDGALRILGVENREKHITLESFWLMILPEDVHIAKNHFEETIRTKEFRDFECRFKHSDKSIKTIHISGEILLDNKGKPVRMLGIIQDITIRKQEEELLRRSEAKFKSLFENLSSAFVLYKLILDNEKNPVDLEYVEVNPAFEEITGVLSGDIIGKTLKEIYPQTEEYWMKHFAQVARTGEPAAKIDYSIEMDKYFDMVAFCPEIGYCATIATDVTDRIKNEEALRASEERYRLLFENMPSSFNLYKIICNDNGEPVDYQFIETNSMFEEYSGLSRDAVIGKNVKTIFPDTEDYWIKLIGNVGQTGTPIHYTNYAVELSRYFEVYAYSPEKNYCAAIFNDVTERIKNEEILNKFKTSIDYALDGIYWINGEAGFDYVNDQACKMLGYTHEELIQLTLLDIDPNGDYKVFNNYWKRLCEKKQTEFSNIVSTHIRKDGSTFPVELSSVFIWKDNKGLLIAYAKDITERKEYENSLLKNQKLLNDSQKAGKIGSWEYLLETDKFIWNDQVYEIYGVDKSDKLNYQNFMDLVHPDDQGYIERKNLETLQQGVFTEYEFRIIRPDNIIRYLRTSGNIEYTKDNRPYRSYGIVQDITEQKKIEENLRLFKTCIDLASDAVYWLNKDARFEYVNEKQCENLGYTREELLSMTVMDKDPETTKELWDSRWEQIKSDKAANHTISFETIQRRKDGSIFPAEVVNNYFKFGDREFIIGYTRDITERKQYEENILKNQKMLRDSQKVAKIGSWENNMHERKFIWQEEVYHILGYENKEFEPTYENFRKIVYPKDLPKLLEIQKKTIDTKTFIEHEYRIIRKDGAIRIVHAYGDVIFNDKKEVVGTYGIIQDITEQKKNEEDLIESEQKLKSLFRVTPSGLGIVKDRVFVDVNPYFCVLTGYSEEELIGKDSMKLYTSEEEFLRIGKELYEQIAKEGTSKTGTQWVRKDGSIVYVYIFISAIDPNDYSKGNIFAVFDMTEKKQYEEALEKRVLALTRPLDDIGSIEFTDLFNIDELQQLQDAFAKATNVASIITFPDGTPITKPSNSCKLCNIVRSTEKGLQNCMKSDAKIGTLNLKGPNIQPCFSAGLWDAGASITLGGIHVANWLIGQVRNKDVKEKEVIAYADEIGISREEFSKAFRQVNIMSKEQFQAITDALYLLANEISLKTYQNLQQARFIAEQKKTEEERKMMNVELERRVIERTLQLQQANKELESFAYSVSHDLRAPIRHINGFMHLLDNALNTTDTKIKNYINKVLLSSENMSVMIDELLQFSRLGRTDLKSKLVLLKPIIEELVTQLKPDYEGRNVKWIINELPQVYGDPTLLKIAFENLVSNAIKYTAKKEKAIIEIGEKKINQSGKACIFVKDNGAGFDMAYKDKLFNVFQRLHTKEEFEGVGIGLANVQKIITKHNGNVDAEGEIDKGATFLIILPREKQG